MADGSFCTVVWKDNRVHNLDSGTKSHLFLTTHFEIMSKNSYNQK